MLMPIAYLVFLVFLPPPVRRRVISIHREKERPMLFGQEFAAAAVAVVVATTATAAADAVAAVRSAHVEAARAIYIRVCLLDETNTRINGLTARSTSIQM